MRFSSSEIHTRALLGERYIFGTREQRRVRAGYLSDVMEFLGLLFIFMSVCRSYDGIKETRET